ncbi:MAG: FAD-binding oxidoreductase [Mycobacterium sp.]
MSQTSTPASAAYDFVIVGAGAYGCATAFHLALGGASVALVDAGSVADGASGGWGKRGVRANRRDLRELELMREAYDLWPTLADDLKEDCGYVRTGGVCLVEESPSGSASGLAAARLCADVQNDFGIPTEIWDERTVRERFPAVTKSVKAAIYAPLDGMSSHQATTTAYARAAERHGVVLVENSKVDSLVTDSAGRVSGVTVDQGEALVAARQAVVLTNNYGSLRLVQAANGFKVPIRPILPQAILVRSEHSPDIPYLTGHDSRALSVKVLDDDVVMLSGGWRGRWDDETSRGVAIDENVRANLDLLSSTFPDLGALSVLAADAGRIESASVDHIPFIDTVPGTSNLVIATGWTGHGWALVPAASRNIAQWLLTGGKPRALQPFAFARAMPPPSGRVGTA